MRTDTTMIHPRLVEKLNQLVKVCKDNGITIEFSSGYRSFAEQDKLYAQGRTEPGMKVTNARGGYSQHNWGIAADFFWTWMWTGMVVRATMRLIITRLFSIR